MICLYMSINASINMPYSLMFVLFSVNFWVWGTESPCKTVPKKIQTPRDWAIECSWNMQNMEMGQRL